MARSGLHTAGLCFIRAAVIVSINYLCFHSFHSESA